MWVIAEVRRTGAQAHATQARSPSLWMAHFSLVFTYRDETSGAVTALATIIDLG